MTTYPARGRAGVRRGDMAGDIATFRSMFDVFSGVTDPEITTALNVAHLFVDPLIWDPGDYPDAVMFFAAHFLSLMQQQLASVQIGGAGSMDLFIRSVGFGERRVMFGERTGMVRGEVQLGAGETMLQYTIYGMTYLQLRNRNVPAVAIV